MDTRIVTVIMHNISLHSLAAKQATGAAYSLLLVQRRRDLIRINIVRFHVVAVATFSCCLRSLS